MCTPRKVPWVQDRGIPCSDKSPTRPSFGSFLGKQENSPCGLWVSLCANHPCLRWAVGFSEGNDNTTCVVKVCSWLVSWRRQWHPTPVFLPGKSHGWRSLVGCSPWGREESDMTEQLHFHFSFSCIGKGNGNPLQCSCLENPRDGGAWWAAVYGVSQSWTRLKRLSSSSSWVFVATRTLLSLWQAGATL